MKKNIFISLRLTLVMILICAVIYPLFIAMAGRFSAGNGNGEKIFLNGKTVGYTLIGQQFSDKKYFHGRPSANNYNAALSGGSNKSASNEIYLKEIQARIDSFLVNNPGIKKSSIPAELVTASGSGLDPHISPAAALVQVKRIANSRNINENKIISLIENKTNKPLFGPATINVLQLNLALDTIK